MGGGCVTSGSECGITMTLQQTRNQLHRNKPQRRGPGGRNPGEEYILGWGPGTSYLAGL